MHTRARLLLVALCCLTTGCTSFKRPDERARTLFPGLAADADVQSLYSKSVRLPVTPRVALFWLDEPGPLPDSERTRLLHHFNRELNRPPLATVSAIPSTRTRSHTDGTGLDLDALRSAAASFQSDVLMLILTRTDAYNDWNLLSLSYLALLPMFVVPGDDLSTYVTAEACAIDVRTGVFLGCAQGNGDAARSFVTPLGRESRKRELVVSATEAALQSLPQQLSDIVVARLERGTDTYETE